MTAKEKDILEKAGVDIASAMDRFDNDESFMMMFVKKFTKDTSMESLSRAVEEKDYDTMFRAAHTIKGISGNVGLTKLYTVCDELVKKYRAGDNEGAMAVYPDIKKAYDTACEHLNTL